jgi:hypothetical protein
MISAVYILLASSRRTTSLFPRLISMSLLLVLFAPACGAEDRSVQVGFIEWVDEAFAFDAPSTVQAGQSFEGILTTYGDGCVSLDRTDVLLHADSASITPFDREQPPSDGAACPLNVVLVLHHAQLVFASPGNKTITVYGRRQPGGGSANSPTDVQHEISVVVE